MALTGIRPSHSLFSAGLAFVIGLSLAGSAQATEISCGRDAEQIFASAEGSVVQILAIAVNPFLVSGRITPRGGSGFVLENGLIATNYHVIANAHDLVVSTEDGVASVGIVGADPALDIALLELWDPLEVGGGLSLAPAEAMRVGQNVFALGYPLGIGKSVSAGIVSGVSRVLQRTTTSWLSPYLQTDAAISQGNSGGPLLDDCGRVLGMITAGISREGAENLGFAIPVDVLKPVLEELAETGHIARPWHGLYGQMVTPPVLLMLGVPMEEWEAATGFLVETIEPGSAGERAGLVGGNWPVLWGGSEYLLGGDIITHVNGRRIDTYDAAIDAVLALQIGETVELQYLRWGEQLSTRVEIDERPMLQQEIDLYMRFTRKE
jgi:S1-C subfamily serine protease